MGLGERLSNDWAAFGDNFKGMAVKFTTYKSWLKRLYNDQGVPPDMPAGWRKHLGEWAAK
jgi:hypothetical protein